LNNNVREFTDRLNSVIYWDELSLLRVTIQLSLLLRAYRYREISIAGLCTSYGTLCPLRFYLRLIKCQTCTLCDRIVPTPRRTTSQQLSLWWQQQDQYRRCQSTSQPWRAVLHLE